MVPRADITGIAVVLGSASGGLACRDFDDESAYQRWATEHPKLASTLPTVQTARGAHVYFRPEGFNALGDGEYRASSGHYCLVPPSRHPTGMFYDWIVPLPSGQLPDIDPDQAGLLAGSSPFQTQEPSHSAHNTHLCEQGIIPTAIAESQPTAVGQRRRKLFDLARRLKAIMPNANSAELKPIIRQWFEMVLPVIGTKDWAVTWEDFVGAWTSAMYPVGGNWDEFVQMANEMVVDTRGHDGAVADIIRLCAALQAHHGPGKVWPLSCRLAGEYAHVSHERAARILKMLVFEDIIELVSPGGKKGSKQAAEYRFKGAP
jgi:bifunctional DNA primase/polymerase-like protein